MRRGVYYPHLYIVKDDGEPPLRLWALSMLIQDRADVLPSYQQFLSSLKEKVCLVGDNIDNAFLKFLLFRIGQRCDWWLLATTICGKFGRVAF
jgi:hypothetical protein